MDTRRSLMRNHTVAHMLTHALCQVLGKNVQLQGSSITSSALRIDVDCNHSTNVDQLKQIDQHVNVMIAKRLSIN